MSTHDEDTDGLMPIRVTPRVAVDVEQMRRDLTEALARVAALEADNAQMQRALAKRGRRLVEMKARLTASGV